MKLTISAGDNIISVDIPGSLSLDDFKAYLQAETDLEPTKQILKLNGKVVEGEGKTLEELSINDNDLIVLESTQSGSSSNVATSAPTGNNQVDNQIEMTRQQFLNDPTLNNQLRQSTPDLHSSLQNPQEFKRKMLDQMHKVQQQGGNNYNPQQQQDLRNLQNNPDDPESQAKILELIRQEQVDENMRLAYDITPESFASVNMLYINIKVNGHKVQAFVDSGAQTTIISPRLAETCGISRLIDKRFKGEARGVGSQLIEGKIHSVPIYIGDSDVEIPCSFTVLDTQVDLLFGLDMLRRHKCIIDLVADELVVGGHIRAKFLHESEIENKVFGAGPPPQGSQGTSLGTNIFADQGVKKPAPDAAGVAAAKRQNTSSATPAASASLAYTPTEAEIKQLTDLGFSKPEAIAALKQTDGNVELAASFLF